MEKQGKRPYYIIYNVNDWDGIDTNIWYATRNLKDAISHFRYYYDVFVHDDFVGENGEVYADHDYSFDDRNKDNVRGCFWYATDDGATNWYLKTVYSNVSLGWGERPNERLENAYLEHINGRRDR